MSRGELLSAAPDNGYASSIAPLCRTDQRSAAGRALDALSNELDRDARPVRCNGWLSRLSCGREYVLPSVENRRLRTERVRLRSSCAPCASEIHASKMRPQPRHAASIAAMSIFFICIIASNARLAAAGSGPKTAFVRAIGVICQDNPHLSLHQPHALSWPPLPTIAFQ